MLGRAREASLVESLIGDARGGVSGSLLVSGEPGIGKTVLLAHARGAGEGALILEATGAEGESHLPFAGLADLLRPVLGHLDELPEPQAAALRGALALGPPVPGDRFTTYAGTLSLLAAAADRGAVVCIIDDAHWLDAESVEAVQFVARRLGAEGIAILLGARDGISERIDASPLPRLRLGRLNAADSVALLTRHSVVEPAPAVAQALDAGAGGNPLALIELAESLTPGPLTGADPSAQVAPNATLLPPYRIAPGATVGHATVGPHAVVGPGAHVGDGAWLTHTVFWPGATATGHHDHAIVTPRGVFPVE
ncbi:MAG TPA: AAA family ATPase, partial [Miltoncostaeaceae bacterium]|nr:AAA family ATPase [Miltoncostaeaceae bacterium]